MTNFATASAILSTLLFFGFIALSVVKFKILSSYSAYATKWDEAVPLNHMNLWSLITLVAAVLLCFPMLEIGDESPVQFLGFASPVYLGVVALTPGWETNRKQHIIHSIGAGICALAAVLWIILTVRLWYLLPISLLAAWCGAYFTNTIKSAYVFWLEMAMFVAIYAVVFVAVLFRF